MRFIGSKALLLQNIEYVVNQNTVGSEESFCDIFSGTGIVARYFKPKYKIYSNDMLYFSYVLQKATIENNKIPNFKKLQEIGISDPIKFLEESHVDLKCNFFITNNYSPTNNCQRMYIMPQNAKRIDFIRHTIEEWKSKKIISESEYYYLLASLIEGIPYISNITGTYGAYLKNWDKRALKNFGMVKLDVYDNKKNNKSYNKDANKLILEIEGDILYLDPPYNNRQYIPNYHILETVSRCDNPQIYGITGMRPYDNEKSVYSVKDEVLLAFEHLIEKANFQHIILSYNSEGLMFQHQIEQIIKRHGIASSYKLYSIPYKKYQSKIKSKKTELFENIFYIKKNIPKVVYFDLKSTVSCAGNIKSNSTNKYIKSPFNYIGGKYKLLSQILPLIPNDVNTFVDLFTGGGNVAINVNVDRILCNDINSKIIEIFQAFKAFHIEDILGYIEKTVNSFGLSKENEKGFLKFKDYYNSCLNPNPLDLYVLSCFSFNYQFRFNNNHKFNNPFGKNRSHFSNNMRDNLISFVNKLKSSNIEFKCSDFIKLDPNSFEKEYFIYCDPPYLITTGSYNDGNRGFKGWGKKEEIMLYSYLDKVNKQGIRFALSNVLEHKGKSNDILKEWVKNYNITYFNFDYSNSNYQSKRGKSKEVLITNY